METVDLVLDSRKLQRVCHSLISSFKGCFVCKGYSFAYLSCTVF